MRSKTPEYVAEYWKRWRAKHHPYVDIVCVECGTIFHKQSIKDGTAKTCPSCRLGKCARCGKQFRREHLNRKFCSRKCKDASLAGAEPAWLAANRGKKPRTYHKAHRNRHGSALDREWRIAVLKRDKA